MEHEKEISEIRSFINEINGTSKYPHKDDVFDLDTIPMEVLDDGYVAYGAFNIGLPYRHPLRAVMESEDFNNKAEHAKDVITSTYPIDKSNFRLINGHNGMVAALLIAVVRDNVEVIEAAMDKLGFYRANPVGDNLLSDSKDRVWFDIRFEPKPANDLTDLVRNEYQYVYHTAPSIFADKIKANGLIPFNSNPEFRYNEPRVYLIKGSALQNDIQELVNELYLQAKQKGISNLSPKYTLFTIAVDKIPSNVRFYGDINEDKGIFITNKIDPTAFVSVDEIIAQEN